MNPDDPSVAQQVVAAYAAVLERYGEERRFPASLSALPYSRDTIKASIRTSLNALRSSGQLTDDLREFLKSAYVGLADFIDDELARLMTDYNAAGAELASTHRWTAERVNTASWRTLEETSALAGRIAQAIASDAERLRDEFRRLEG